LHLERFLRVDRPPLDGSPELKVRSRPDGLGVGNAWATHGPAPGFRSSSQAGLSRSLTKGPVFQRTRPSSSDVVGCGPPGSPFQPVGVEHDRPAAVNYHPVLEMGQHRLREHTPLDVAS
jgi:hypothetical protein